MEDKLVMETGLMDYDYLHKPVKYTDEFLSSLTGNGTYDVHNEHYGEKVGEVTQLYYKGNGLYASFNKDFDVGDKGFSTVLSVSELEEHDDCYVPIPGMARIESVDIVSNPKFTATICNSKDIFNKKDNETDEDNRMSSELEDKLLENGALKQKLNDKSKIEESLRAEISELKDKLKSSSSEIDELKSKMESDSNSSAEKYDAVVKELDSYKAKEREHRRGLAVKIAESQIADDVDDRESAVNALADNLVNLDESALEIMSKSEPKSKKVEDTPYKGVPAGNDAGEAPREKTINDYNEDMTADDFKELSSKLGIKL